LENTLAEIKRLQGTVTTVCAWTKRIKDHGEWISFEEFMSKHLGIHFTHGISEEALQELKQDFPPWQATCAVSRTLSQEKNRISR